ncbi:hypothetical protein Lal_00031127 [Lupinus albus]|uniref:Putative transcription factor C2H2 family n=1 Tax=Lupinus albus TaxID=3870 RepID=A0A6A5LVY0_LUPAL|nr:putative transcription factor C2H2 family [Lupinus albus]KAF1863983.1 hypothetical protein Lal_00031127 [Lupinus albus]
MRKHRTHRRVTTINDLNQKPQKREKQKQTSWAVIKGSFTCKNVKVIEHQKQKKLQESKEKNNKCKQIKCPVSLCNEIKVMATGTPEDVHNKRDSKMMSGEYKNNVASYSSRSIKAPLNEINGLVYASSFSSSSISSASDSFRGMPLRKLSGCYEYTMVVDHVTGLTRDPSTLRGIICSYPYCDEFFMNPESFEYHHAIRHAVSELVPEDTSKNIVEIIFQSSWLKKQSPMYKIDRILKVNNTQKTLSKFEEYRDSIKDKATQHSKKHPRCIADGNEVLRFHCTTFMCTLGQSGSSNLCNLTPQCKACNIIKNGFKVTGEESKGILTYATSGKAHEKVVDESNERRAMFLCRVIAGRVKKNGAESDSMEEEYDSVVVGDDGAYYSNFDELYVFNHTAILSCFVVIYRTF